MLALWIAIAALVVGVVNLVLIYILMASDLTQSQVVSLIHDILDRYRY